MESKDFEVVASEAGLRVAIELFGGVSVDYFEAHSSSIKEFLKFFRVQCLDLIIEKAPRVAKTIGEWAEIYKEAQCILAYNDEDRAKKEKLVQMAQEEIKRLAGVRIDVQIRAKIKKIKYFPGDHLTVNGVKRKEKNYSFLGGIFKNRGTGYGEFTYGSSMVAQVQIENQGIELDIGRFFKENLGKLTEKRRKAIEQTMPEEISVKKVQGNIRFPYQAKEEELQAWLDRVRQVI